MDLFNALRTMRLLLIDDDEWVRDSLRLFFESEGCRITALESAEDGLKLIDQQYFDIIIVDYRLPGMDGIEFIQRLPQKQAGGLKVLITAYGNKEVMEMARRAGIHETILKPFDSEAVETTLKRLIHSRDAGPDH
jgi:CheY-like chemotaxis protein